jgi:hypothetical protein
MRGRWHFRVALRALILVSPAMASTELFQYEILGASANWIVVRENIAASAADTAACAYPGLDPSQFVGATVHFIQLPAEAKRGRLVPLPKPASSMALYTPATPGGCTTSADAERRRNEIAARAKDLDVTLPANPPVPVVLGAPVPAKACALMEAASPGRTPCNREFKRVVHEKTIRIAVSLTAIPEAPDEKVCQFVGHRFGVAVQMAGLDFGKMGSGVAPGGFAEHYDCRSQQFNSLRLYLLDRFLVLLGGFGGTNIANSQETPFLIIAPNRLAP